jgi:hypothetical protein
MAMTTSSSINVKALEALRAPEKWDILQERGGQDERTNWFLVSIGQTKPTFLRRKTIMG